MKVNVNELQVKRAKTDRSMTTFEKKYGKGIDVITKQSFSKNSKFPFYASYGMVSILHNDTVIAACMYDQCNTIYNMCVAEDYRNNGVCRLLLEKCIDLMKSEGLTRVFIDSSNPYAQKLIEDLGFICKNSYVYKKYYYMDI